MEVYTFQSPLLIRKIEHNNTYFCLCYGRKLLYIYIQIHSDCGQTTYNYVSHGSSSFVTIFIHLFNVIHFCFNTNMMCIPRYLLIAQ